MIVRRLCRGQAARFPTSYPWCRRTAVRARSTSGPLVYSGGRPPRAKRCGDGQHPVAVELGEREQQRVPGVRTGHQAALLDGRSSARRAATSGRIAALSARSSTRISAVLQP